MADLIDAPEEGSAAEVTAPMDDIPEQFQGKDQKELVDMYRSLERKMGQQSEELGTLRKLQDQLLTPSSSNEAVTEEIDFYSDPEKAVKRIIERELAPFQELTAKQQQESTVQKLNANYPNWEETAKGEDFQTWISKSQERTKLFLRANDADYSAAAELFDVWGSISNKQAEVSNTTKKAVDRDRKLRAATTEKGSAGIDNRKILSRADLISLRQTNPSRYNDLLPDIRKAYAEGRVR